MADSFIIIIVENINETQRMQIQTAVQAKSENWWHQLTNVWIVESEDSPSDWLKLLGVIFPNGTSSLLVFNLPDSPPKRRFSSKMFRGKADWLVEHYTGPIRNKEIEHS
jgi:hypothetical protein